MKTMTLPIGALELAEAAWSYESSEMQIHESGCGRVDEDLRVCPGWFVTECDEIRRCWSCARFMHSREAVEHVKGKIHEMQAAFDAWQKENS